MVLDMTFTASHPNIRVLLSLLAQNEQTPSYSLLDSVSVIPTELQGFSSDGNNLVTEGRRRGRVRLGCGTRAQLAEEHKKIRASSSAARRRPRFSARHLNADTGFELTHTRRLSLFKHIVHFM